MEEFKVFYSFQSDSNHQTNFHFIRDLLEDVCKSIKNYSVVLDWGFKETSGNRPLTDHMLGQSEKADIFIGDVTYTSEYNTHVLKKHWLLSDYSKISKKGKVKKYPNGNVLIETGYSWAVKGFKSTILLMNTAYGHPEIDELPVDMSHTQWPTLYELDPKRLDDATYVEKCRNTLKGTLKKEILRVIKFERESLAKAFEPIYFLVDSPIAKDETPYILTDAIKKSLLNYRKILEIPGSSAFLKGPIKSGKAKFANELFRKNLPFKKHDCLSKTFYHDFKLGDVSAIHRSLQKMLQKKQHYVVIFDNCTEELMDILETVVKGSNLSLLYLINSK